MTEKGLKYIADIIHAIELIEEFTISIPLYSDYEKDQKTQSAVERQLGIIGEAVNKIHKLGLNPGKSDLFLLSRLIY